MSTTAKRPRHNNNEPKWPLLNEMVTVEEMTAQETMMIPMGQNHSNYPINLQLDAFDCKMAELRNNQWCQNADYLNGVYTNALELLSNLKRNWILHQRQMSLAFPPVSIDAYNLAQRYQEMLTYLNGFPEAFTERHNCIKNSMTIEWPKTFVPFANKDGEEVTVDRPALIYYAKNGGTANIRKEQPIIQLRVLALSSLGQESSSYVQAAYFRARLMTKRKDNKWSAAHGKLRILKKQGEDNEEENSTCRMTCLKECAACSGVYEDCDTCCPNCKCVKTTDKNYMVIDQGWVKQHTTPQFDNNSVLCAKFHDGAYYMGIDIGGQKQDSCMQQYRIEIDCFLKFNDGLTLEHTVNSQSFVIASNKDSDEKILGEMVWGVLTCDLTPDDDRPLYPGASDTCNWGQLQQMIRHVVQMLLATGRVLDDQELLHVQCMLFLPLVYQQSFDEEKLNELEKQLFGGITQCIDRKGIRKLKYLLLRKPVLPSFYIRKNQLLKDRCLDLTDGTELGHSVWEWLFQAVSMLADSNQANLIAPDTKQSADKSSKHSLMLPWFNHKWITMSSNDRGCKAFKRLDRYDKKMCRPQTRAILLRFCGQKAGHLCFDYSNLESPETIWPTHGSLSADEIRNSQIGSGKLAGILMEGNWPKQFDRLVRFHTDTQGNESALFPKKNKNLSNKRQHIIVVEDLATEIVEEKLSVHNRNV